MYRHIIRQIAQAVPTLFGVVVLVFCLLQFVPGDPIQAMVGDAPVPPALRAALNERFHLDDPFSDRLYHYVANVGPRRSWRIARVSPAGSRSPAQRLPRTLLLAGCGYALGIFVGVAIGLHSAASPRRGVDQMWSTIVLVGYAMPTFWVGQLLVMLFAIKLGWLPTQGMGPMISSASGLDWVVERATYLALPVLTYSIVEATRSARFMRASANDTLDQGYVITARQKELSRGEIVRRHVVRNSILPVITVMGYSFGTAIGGAVLIETVFSYPGVGMLMIEAVRARDTQVIVGVVLLVACSVVIMNVVVDILYAWLDPRIHISGAKG